ncbi:alanine dehydrogenase [Plesiomonas sp.]|uniref:alanine dehydrogenase n=1 Tax=Plesiomonas sp. TaxID=2486279 RepID=UPI003F344596
MIIGIPKEIKNHEYRVGMTPAGVKELSVHGHQLLVQTHAGSQIGFTDADYIAAGARIVSSSDDVFANAEMIVKVKELQTVERTKLLPSQVLFTYLHLAADMEQTHALLQSDAICIAYETVTHALGGLPLLAPMSEVAGRMAVQAGAHALEKSQGGSGILLGGVPGIPAAHVVIFGGGVVGANAARIAVGMRATVTLFDNNIDTLRRLDTEFAGRVQLLSPTHAAIQSAITHADLIIGAVLIPGASAPKLLSRDDLKIMKAGTVLVDVAIDQGGCFATSHPTTHDNPTYIIDNIVHYCVANMPGAVAKTATLALCNATLPYIIQLADQGCLTAMQNNPHLANGLNIYRGKLTSRSVADSLNLPFTPLRAILQGA